MRQPWIQHRLQITLQASRGQHEPPSPHHHHHHLSPTPTPPSTHPQAHRRQWLVVAAGQHQGACHKSKTKKLNRAHKKKKKGPKLWQPENKTDVSILSTILSAFQLFDRCTFILKKAKTEKFPFHIEANHKISEWAGPLGHPNVG